MDHTEPAYPEPTRLPVTRRALPGASAFLCLISSLGLLALAWSIIDNDEFYRIKPFGIVVFAVCLTMSFGISLGATIRARWPWKLLLLPLAATSGWLIALVLRSGV